MDGSAPGDREIGKHILNKERYLHEHVAAVLGVKLAQHERTVERPYNRAERAKKFVIFLSASRMIASFAVYELTEALISLKMEGRKRRRRILICPRR